jgi:hypothetical protein
MYPWLSLSLSLSALLLTIINVFSKNPGRRRSICRSDILIFCCYWWGCRQGKDDKREQASQTYSSKGPRTHALSLSHTNTHTERDTHTDTHTYSYAHPPTRTKLPILLFQHYPKDGKIDLVDDAGGKGITKPVIATLKGTLINPRNQEIIHDAMRRVCIILIKIP